MERRWNAWPVATVQWGVAAALLLWRAGLRPQPRLALSSLSSCCGFPVVRSTDVCHHPWPFTFFPPPQVMFPFSPEQEQRGNRLDTFPPQSTSIHSPLNRRLFKCVFVSVCLSVSKGWRRRLSPWLEVLAAVSSQHWCWDLNSGSAGTCHAPNLALSPQPSSLFYFHCLLTVRMVKVCETPNCPFAQNVSLYPTFSLGTAAVASRLVPFCLSIRYLVLDKAQVTR